MAKIESGNKRILKEKAKVEARDTELYCITDDPYEAVEPTKPYKRLLIQTKN